MTWTVRDGYQPWVAAEGSHPGSDLATLTIVARSENALTPRLDKVLADVRASYPRVFRWHALARPVPTSRVQAYRLLATLGTSIPGFGEPRIDLAGETPTVVAELVPPLSPPHLAALADYSRTLLILVPNASLDEGAISAALSSPGAAGRDLEPLVNASVQRWGSLVGRYYSDGCHAHAIDLFGTRAGLRPFEDALRVGDHGID